MVNFLATVIALAIFVLPVVILGIIIIKWANRPSKKAKAEPVMKYRIERAMNWVVDTENAEKFVRAYRDELQENSDYYLSKKELLEDSYEGEKIYKYEPLGLPLKMEGLDVYSYIDEDEWIKVGRLKKNADIDGDLHLFLYVNDYKRIGYDNVEKETGNPYFGVEVSRKIWFEQ